VRLFAFAFIAQALATFWHDITHLAQAQATLATDIPAIDFDRDLTIVAVSARLTIALIPVALVWLVASRVARWLVVAFALGKLVMAARDLVLAGPGDTFTPLWLAPLLLTLASAALLLTPGAARWFSRRDAPLSRPPG
jgi:hypothetical protein